VPGEAGTDEPRSTVSGWSGPADTPGMHKVIDAGPMPAYVRRPHDELLRAVLDPAVRWPP